MPIRYRCPSCGQLLGISSRMAGLEFPCPQCREVSIVPDPGRVEAGPLSAPPETFAPAEDDRPAAHDIPVFAGAVEREAAVGLSRPAEAHPDEEVEATVAAESGEDAGAFRVSRRSLDGDDMDLTPMVDMTFLLLIFFMITASFSVQKSIAFPPPSPEQKGAVQTTFTLDEFENNSVVIRIDDRNVIYVDDEPVADPGRLIDMLKASLSTQRNEVILTADDNALHDTVVQVIDAANAAGMQRIRLASRGVE